MRGEGVLFLEAGAVPDTVRRLVGLLGPGEEGIEGFGAGGTEPYYPARTLPVKQIADHHPVILVVPGWGELERPKVRALKVGGLSAGAWGYAEYRSF